MEAEQRPRRFVPPPGYTQIPNILFDEYLPECNGSEWQVLTMIARQTFGWGLEERLLSTEALATLTGLSRQAVSKALKGLDEKGMIGKRHHKSNQWLYGVPVKKVDAVKKVGSPESRQPSTDSSPTSNTRTTKGTETKSGVSPSGNKADIGQQLQHPPGEGELWIDDVIKEVFTAWHSGTGMNGNSKLTPERKKKIRLRLEEASVDGGLVAGRREVLDAVGFVVHSDWHRANGHQDFTLIFRSRDSIEKYAKLERQKRDSLPPPPDPRFAGYDTTTPNPELEGGTDAA